LHASFSTRAFSIKVKRSGNTYGHGRCECL
jgi:hypothetical protein